MKVPILFLTFNRPDLAKQVFEKISLYKPDKIYFASDGPRLNNEFDQDLVFECRKIIRKINWNCEIITKFEETNLGCAKGVSSSIDWFFQNEECGIILEDDTLPSESFFYFCEELLFKYFNNQEISIISGDNFSDGKLKLKDSYYYSKYTHVWGWASWARSWKNYKLDISDDLFKFEEMKEDFTLEEFHYWNHLFYSLSNKNYYTWDIQFAFYNFINRKINIMPKVNLITNIGFREDATHTTNASNISNLRFGDLDFPLSHPKIQKINEKADLFSRKTFIPSEKKSFIEKLKEAILGL